MPPTCACMPRTQMAARISPRSALDPALCRADRAPGARRTGRMAPAPGGATMAKLNYERLAVAALDALLAGGLQITQHYYDPDPNEESFAELGTWVPLVHSAGFLADFRNLRKTVVGGDPRMTAC